MRCADHIKPQRQLGYGAWHVKAAESHRRGESQTQCDQCKHWMWSWEMKKRKQLAPQPKGEDR